MVTVVCKFLKLNQWIKSGVRKGSYQTFTFYSEQSICTGGLKWYEAEINKRQKACKFKPLLWAISCTNIVFWLSHTIEPVNLDDNLVYFEKYTRDFCYFCGFSFMLLCWVFFCKLLTYAFWSIKSPHWSVIQT